MDENYRYGGGESQSLLHPAVAALLLICIVCMFVLPRKHLALPLIWMTVLVPGGQQLVVFGAHLFVLRLVIMAGIARMLASPKDATGNRLAGGTNGIDRAFLIYMVAQAVCPIILFHELQSFIYEVGFLVDWLGGYYLLRWILQDEQDVYRSLKYLAVSLIPVTLGMMIEKARMFNVFSVLGGVSAVPAVREGSVRAQGVFAHALMAGAFGATLVPLYFILWKSGKAKLLGTLGLVCTTIIALSTGSSSPLMAFLAGVGAIALWPMRKKMKLVRRGIVVALIGLQMVMKAPIWFLIARVDFTGGSSSYHRAALVDSFIWHFSSWWLIGTNDAQNWGLDMWDVQNQYVNVGEAGGLIALVYFILVISRSYGRLGDARKRIDGDVQKEWLLWFLGCAMFANVVGYFGVNYFDQSRMEWLLLLAAICAVTAPILQELPLSTAQSDTGARNMRLPFTKPQGSGNDGKSRLPVRPGKLEPRLR